MRIPGGLAVLSLTFLSRVLGFVRSGLTLWLFPGVVAADRWNAVLALPNGFRKLLAEGSLGLDFAFRFSRDVEVHGKAPGWDYLIKQAGWSFAVFAGLYLLAPTYVGLFYPDAAQDVNLLDNFRLSFLYIPMSALSSVPAGFLMFRRRNHLLIAGTLGFSLVSIAGLFWVAAGLGDNWGLFLALGGLVQLVALSILARCWEWAAPGAVRSTGTTRNWLSQLIYAAVPPLLLLVIQVLASRSHEEGALTALSIQYNLIQLPLGMLVNSHAMESFSRGFQNRDHGARHYLGQVLKLAPWMMVLSMGILVFERDVMVLLFGFERQELWKEGLLFLFSLGVPAIAVQTFLQKYYAARGWQGRSLLLLGVGTGVGFGLSVGNLPWCWTASVSVGALALLMPILIGEGSRRWWIVGLPSLSRHLLTAVPACIGLVFADRTLEGAPSPVRLLVAGGVVTLLLLVPAYVWNWKGVRFWED